MTVAKVQLEGRLRPKKSFGVRFMNGFANRFVKGLLRSPAHGLLSGSFAVVTVSGRRTGRKYSTPVNYVADGDVLTIVSSRDRTWWRNLERGGGWISVRARGKQRKGTAKVLPLSASQTTEAYREYVGRLRGKDPRPERLARAGETKVVIRVKLEPVEP